MVFCCGILCFLGAVTEAEMQKFARCDHATWQLCWCVLLFKGPKLMKYMDEGGNPVKERPPSTTGGGWGEISSSDDDSDSEL